MGKRLLWKTISFTNPHELYEMRASWTSSHSAFGKGRVMHFDEASLETNLRLIDLRALARLADVKIDFRNGILWDTEPRMNTGESKE